MKTLRLVITYYRTIAFVSIFLTLCCISIVYKWGSATLTAIIWFKMLTLFATLFHINSFRNDELFYYKNLGVPKTLLWISTSTLDILLFLFLAILTIKMR